MKKKRQEKEACRTCRDVNLKAMAVLGMPLREHHAVANSYALVLLSIFTARIPRTIAWKDWTKSAEPGGLRAKPSHRLPASSCPRHDSQVA